VHCRWIDAHPFGDPCQRPASFIQPHRFIDLPRHEPAATHGHAVSAQDLTDRSPVDPELLAELVDRRSDQVTRDELFDLLFVKLLRGARSSASSRRTRWCGSGGQFLEASSLLARRRVL
jgi:hypothetical protein